MNFRVNTSKGVKVRIHSATQDPDVPLTVNPLRGSVDPRFRARLADSPCVRGSGAPRRAFLAIPVITLCALFALSVSVAHAEPPRLVPDGSLSTGGFVPDGVAVDQASGDLYVASFITPGLTEFGHVDKFDAVGKRLSPPSPFAQGLDGGTAVNPTNGDVYVSGNSPTAIGTYDANTGGLLSSFEVPPSGNVLGATAVQIAADSAGNVYVPVVPQNEVLEYSQAGGAPLNAFTGGGVLKGPTGVAVDSSGNLWVADNGNNRIEELTPADVPIGEIHSEGVESVALDGHGDVLAIVKNSADFCGSLVPPCAHLTEYSGGGAQLADVGAGSFDTPPALVASLPAMLAVSDASGRVYVTNGGGEQVSIFAPPTRPTVAKELSAEVGASEAKLGALVNPGGIEATYRFEYGTTTAYGQSAPSPEGSVGEGFASRTVWASASGLAPGTIYHYRVVATNELGTVAGPDQTFTTQTAAQRSCPNEEFRDGFSAGLPDCRAYELVVPPFKNSSQARGVGPAATDGNALGFVTEEPLPGAPTGSSDYIFTRGADGWVWEGIIPLESYTGILCSNPYKSHEVPAYSDGLSAAIISVGALSRQSEGNSSSQGQGDCNGEGLQVVPGEPVGYRNLLARDNRTGTYRLVNAPPPGVTPADAHFIGASSDLSHVVFSELASLTPDAPAGVQDAYEWDEGALRLLTVLPNGTPAVGSLAAEGEAAQYVSHPISADGSHILFTSGGGLYDRIGGEHTVQVDESHGGSGTGGGGRFWAASTDGSRVLFTDESRLTADSTAASGKPDLYECVLAAGASTCALNDLTVARPGEHAGVLTVSGFGSKDDSHVYFTSKGVLAGNRREYLDSEGNPAIEEAKGGEKNLYLEQGGTITFIATLEEGNFGEGAVSPDGASFAFDSNKSLTGYDNVESAGGQPHEIFVYDAATNSLVCASCNPSGEAPAGGANLPSLQLRPLSNGGRVFFETGEALLPSDTNGHVDVYEFEDGQLSLISTGTSAFEPEAASGGMLKGVSESGGDVFFESTQQLVPQDTAENTIVVYDARVGGGFPAGTPPPPCATADACRTPVSSQPSIYGAPSSQTFSGTGNLAPPLQAMPKVKPKPKAKPAKCREGFVKRKVKGKTRCVRNTARKARKSVHAKKRGH